jgi:hypothetical protein
MVVMVIKKQNQYKKWFMAISLSVCNMTKTKSKNHFSCIKELVAKPRCKKRSIRFVQLIHVLKPHVFVVLPKLHFWPSSLLIWTCFVQFALDRTCAHAHIKVIGLMWCVEHLITKIGRNGLMAHFPFTR